MENNKSETFFIINVVENRKGEILGVKKEVPEGFLVLMGLDKSVNPIWFPPSGFPIRGEKREEAAERIVYEETGYKVKALRSVEGTLTTTYVPSQNRAFLKIVILCELIDENQDQNWQKPDYIEEIRWVHKKDLLKYTLPQIAEKWPESLRKILTQ